MDILKLFSLLLKNDFKLNLAVDQYIAGTISSADEKNEAIDSFYEWYATIGHKEIKHFVDDNQQMLSNYFNLRMYRAMCGDKALDKDLYKLNNMNSDQKLDPILQTLQDLVLEDV